MLAGRCVVWLVYQEVPEGFRLLSVAQRMGDVPGLALLVELMTPDSLSVVSREGMSVASSVPRDRKQAGV